MNCLIDSGYQGLYQLHANSWLVEKTNYHPLSGSQKAYNRALSSSRIYLEHVIGKLKDFAILSQSFRNRGQRFGLGFYLMPSINNLEL